MPLRRSLPGENLSSDTVNSVLDDVFSPPFCFEKALERAYAIDLVSDVCLSVPLDADELETCDF